MADNRKIMDNRKKNPRVPMDQQPICSEKITVVIRLSDAQYVPTVKKTLYKDLNDPEFGRNSNANEITVSAFPPRNNFGENDVLAIARRHDGGARIIRRPT